MLEERVRIVLPPETSIPDKISLNLTYKNTSEEVHFWLR